MDSSGKAVVAGQTLSANFPATVGAFQTTCGGGCVANNAFVSELNATGSALAYSTFLGGAKEQEAFALALDSAGDAYVTGRTGSADYPMTPGSFQVRGGTFDAIFTELNPSGSALIYSTAFGGGASDNGLAIHLTTTGDVYLAGRTYSPDFPTTPGSFKSKCNTCQTTSSDGFVTVFVPGDQVWPLALSFGDQVVGVSSSPLTTTLSNSGSTALSISSMSISGTSANAFTQSATTCGSVLAAGASCTISLTFKPAGTGPEVAQLKITDGAANSPQIVSLKGVGTLVQFAPSQVNYGKVPVGSPKATAIALTNTGATTLSITGIQISGTNATDFSEVNTCGTSVNAGASCTITVTFTPAAKGARSAQVSVTDSGGGSPQTVPLTGLGF